jgi:hypothetical protein
MRTTIRLDDGLFAEAKAEAARSGRTLAQVIEDALRETFGRRTGAARVPGRLPTHAGGPLPGVNLDSWANLLESMEDGAPH